jgi:hypothetical protein
MRKKIVLWLVIISLALAIGFLYMYKAAMAKNITWGAAFSQKHAKDMGLDWEEAYLALLDDLKVKNLKIAAHWDLIEPQDGVYDFSDLDWQMEQAKLHNAKVMLAIGMKTPRWPECHVPEWAKNIGKERQQEKILAMLEALVLRYRGNSAVDSWQVENEPLFQFGDCPWIDKDFLKKEAALARSLDEQKRRVVISDSGEGSWWFNAAMIGDTVAVTMYRRVYFHEIKTYITYPIPPAFYWVKSKIIGLVFKKRVICGELQAEPWAANQLYDGGDSDAKTMDIKQFKNNIGFAENTGFDTFYLWGSEWWYWMKAKHNDSAYWEEAKKLWTRN